MGAPWVGWVPWADLGPPSRCNSSSSQWEKKRKEENGLCSGLDRKKGGKWERTNDELGRCRVEHMQALGRHSRTNSGLSSLTSNPLTQRQNI